MTPYIEAEYESGYIHRENESDRSPYVRDKNIFSDILERRPEAIHGKMIRFSLQLETERLDVDFTVLPDNARPIRFKHMEGDLVDGGLVDTRIAGIDFGYQYTDENGKNVQEVQEVR